MIVLAVALVVATYGVWAFGGSLHRGLTNTDGKMPMDLTAVVVPTLQCLVAAVLAVAFWMASRIRKRRPKDSDGIGQPTALHKHA